MGERWGKKKFSLESSFICVGESAPAKIYSKEAGNEYRDIIYLGGDILTCWAALLVRDPR